jgi:hypothetical protein
MIPLDAHDEEVEPTVAPSAIIKTEIQPPTKLDTLLLTPTEELMSDVLNPSIHE